MYSVPLKLDYVYSSGTAKRTQQRPGKQLPSPTIARSKT